jgi:GTP-binding protein
MPKPLVAIVGRPNVGKSTLFNRITGQRQAILSDVPGTTRDRLYGEAIWNDRTFMLVDTGGMMMSDEEIAELPTADIVQRTREQALVAIEEADVILFIVDAVNGLIPGDDDIADLLRQTRKPVFLTANKADNEERRLNAVEFYQLGLGDPFPTSALHGGGVAELLDALVAVLPPTEQEPAEEAETVRIAIVGRPNVGKSQLLNRLLGEERAIVSNIPGTTRDALDTPLTWGDRRITLIDTAGIRRSGRIQAGVERYSVMRSLRAIERADVALLLVDAEQGITAQDAHVAGFVAQAYRGIVVLLNKWDIVEKDPYTYDNYVQLAREEFKFLAYAPILSISALTGQRVDKAVETALYVYDECRKRVPTAQLNDLVRAAVTDHPPPSTVQGQPVRIYYATQVGVAPPTFVFFLNDPKALHFSYERYLENRIRQIFGYTGAPLKLILRERKKVEL